MNDQGPGPAAAERVPMTSRRPARPARSRRGVAALAAGAGLVVLLAGGCAALPTSGAPQSAPPRPAFGAGSDGCCGLIVRGPQPGWGPQTVVYGFLLASAKPAHNFALAREYLTPGTTRNSWRPSSVVTILAQTPTVSKESHRLSPPGGAVVVVTGQEVATLKGAQYTPVASGEQLAFTLTSVNGQTLIHELPNNGLLLTENLFHLVYTPRDLYYYDLRNNSLVPSPVFVPVDADIPKTLVGYLLHNPPGDLRNALSTGFPPSAQLGPVQEAPGKTAIVSIHLPRATLPSTYRAMARQLVATLTSPGYGPPLFDAVKLKINGKMWSPPGGGPVLTLATSALNLPHPSGSGPVYYVGADGKVRMLTRLAARGQPVCGEAGSGQLALQQLAVSPLRKYLAGIAGPANTVYVGSLEPACPPGARSSAGVLHARLTGTDFRSLSWDSDGNLWVVGRLHHTAGVWVLPGGRGQPIEVDASGLGHVTSLRVAPDGTRVAMIVGTGAKAHLELGYIMRNGLGFSITHLVPLGPSLSAVTALTWYDEDHLVAAAQQGTPGPQLWEVPVNGDGATSLQWTQRGLVTSIAAAGPQNPLYLTVNGQLEKSVGLDELWTAITAGNAVEYPG